MKFQIVFLPLASSCISIPMNKGSDLLWWKVFFSRLRYFLNSTLNNKKHSKHGCADFKWYKIYPNSSVPCTHCWSISVMLSVRRPMHSRLWHYLSCLRSLVSSHDAPSVFTIQRGKSSAESGREYRKVWTSRNKPTQNYWDLVWPCLLYLIVGAEAQSSQGWNPSWLQPTASWIILLLWPLEYFIGTVDPLL